VTREPPRELGKYQITDVLGEGAMGVVYRAYDPILDRYLAVKVMSAVIASDQGLRERFMREARAAGSLQHPNVVTIYDFGEAGEHLYIAMEFIEGADLSEVIRRRDPLTLAQRLDIVIDSLNGLAYAHGRGVVHRDVKPANIRVSAEGRGKLMDFGIARVNSSELTKSGEMIGTPQYMAPEQVMGGEISAATDLFSMASVLYELLTYTRPFNGETLHAVLFNVVSEEPPSILDIDPNLPPALDTIIRRAHAKDPAQRYESATAFARDIGTVRFALSSGGGATMAVRPSQMRHVLSASDVEYLESLGGVAAPGVNSNPSFPGGRSDPGRSRAPGTTSRTNPGTRSGGGTTRTRPPTGYPGEGPAEFVNSQAPTADLPVTIAPTTASGNRMLGVIVGVVATAVIGGGAIWLSRGSGTPATAPAAAPATAPAAAPASQAAAPAATTPEVAASPAPVQVAPPPVAPKLPAASGASADAAVKEFRTTTMAARQRAADAGATAQDLAAGDAQLKVADAAMAKGQASAALSALSTAAARWGDGERAARERAAAAAAARQQVAARPIEQAPAPAPAQPVPTPQVVAAPPPTVAAPAPAAVDPKVEIEKAISAYARAIETEDVGEIRRAYPGLTSQQAQGWDAFFKSVKGLRARLGTDDISVAGNSAEAKVSGSYEYDTRANGSHDKTPVKFNVSLVREGSGWRISNVH
jgi:serine/threonine-protein kinase